MKALLRTTLFMAFAFVAGFTVAKAQNVIKGTVYMDGKPAAGITVEVNRGGMMMTSFDGKYELERDPKAKWIRFTFIDESKREDLENVKGEVFDFAFTGSLPSEGGDGEAAESGDVVLKTAEELIKDQDQDFMNEYSLYSEFYKQNDFKSAKPHWDKIYGKYPKATPNIYIHGARMYEYFIENAKTEAERNKLINDYMKLYDKRTKYFDQKGYILGRKGTYWLKYKLHADNETPPEGEELKKIHKSGYEWLSESVKLQGNETEPPVLLLLMQTTVALFKLGELPKEQVVKNYETTTQIANSIVATSDDEKIVEVTRDQVLPYIEEVFGKSGAADCEALVKIYTPEFQENGDNIDFIKSMLRRLARANCTDTELFGKATEKLYELDPSAEAAYSMARRFIGRGDIDRAKEYYQMAMEQETDQELLATYYYNFALVLYANDHNYPGARDYARKALAINPDYCEANMLIGNIYVSASQRFEGTNIEKASVFWLACDYFEKARRSDDCSIEASEQYARYKKYWPNKEDAFMEGLQSGSTYKVGGWINENTKVRF